MNISFNLHPTENSLSPKRNSNNNNNHQNKELENNLSDKEKTELQKLKQEDQRVKTHENAHKAAAGNLASGSPNYNYKVGPDGKRYAISGDVQINTSKVEDNPDATIKKAQQIRKAALAPGDPSPQDMKVAMEATRMELEARQESNEIKKNANAQKNHSLNDLSVDSKSKNETTNKFIDETINQKKISAYDNFTPQIQQQIDLMF